jgi:hypothetical protein
VRLNNSHIYNRAYVNQLQYDGSKDMHEFELFFGRTAIAPRTLPRYTPTRGPTGAA